jgi:hypothetical protein
MQSVEETVMKWATPAKNSNDDRPERKVYAEENQERDYTRGA